MEDGAIAHTWLFITLNCSHAPKERYLQQVLKVIIEMEGLSQNCYIYWNFAIIASVVVEAIESPINITF